MADMIAHYPNHYPKRRLPADPLFVQERSYASNGHESAASAEEPEVRCRTTNPLKSYGFITPDAVSRKISVHYTDLLGTDFRDLLVEAPVIYMVSCNDRGPIARRVELLHEHEQ